MSNVMLITTVYVLRVILPLVRCCTTA